MQSTLLRALTVMLRPLIKILLRHGVSHSELSDLTKQVYIDIADQDFKLENHKQTTARISVLTGIHRKEVRRIKKLLELKVEPKFESQNRAARVLNGWLQDKRFQQKDGTITDLTMDGETSFTELVKLYSGDLSPKVVLDELLRVGAVEKLENRKIHLCAKAYVPQHSEEEKLRLMGKHSADFLNTIAHNLQTNNQTSRLQLATFSDVLSQASLNKFKSLSEHECYKLLSMLDLHLEKISENDKSSETHISGTNNSEAVEDNKTRFRAGVGVYFFEDEIENKPEEQNSKD